MLMAGRAAQQIVVGKVSAGSAGSDESGLARATKMALAMERSLGFGAIQPLLYRDDKDPTAVLDGNPDLAARIHAGLERAFARAVEHAAQRMSCGATAALSRASRTNDGLYVT